MGAPVTYGYGVGIEDLHGLGPAPEEFVIRQSNVGNMDLCQARVGLMQGQPEQDPSEAMFAGTAVHWLIDLWIDKWLEGVDLAPLSDPDWVEQGLVSVALQKDGFDLLSKFTSPVHLRQWVVECIFMLNAWVEQWMIGNAQIVEEAVGREVQLHRPLGTVKVPGRREPVVVWVSGHPDLYTRTLLVDWKTSSKNWRKGKAFGMVQDDIYSALVEWSQGIRIDQGLFVVGDRAARAWYEHPTRITEASREAALVRAYSHARDLLLGTYSFSPTNSFGDRHWPCSPKYCPAWDACPAKYIGDAKDLLSQETRSLWL